MRKNIYIGLLITIGLLMAMLAYSEYYSIEESNAPLTNIEFTKTEFNLGNIQLGKPRDISFQLKNTGDIPLLIQYVESSCGCIKLKWPNSPIKPGENAEIKISYDAKKTGSFYKSITVFCNTKNGMHKLKIKGVVQNSQEV